MTGLLRLKIAGHSSAMWMFQCLFGKDLGWTGRWQNSSFGTKTSIQARFGVFCISLKEDVMLSIPPSRCSHTPHAKSLSQYLGFLLLSASSADVRGCNLLLRLMGFCVEFNSFVFMILTKKFKAIFSCVLVCNIHINLSVRV